MVFTKNSTEVTRANSAGELPIAVKVMSHKFFDFARNAHLIISSFNVEFIFLKILYKTNKIHVPINMWIKIQQMS